MPARSHPSLLRLTVLPGCRREELRPGSAARRFITAWPPLLTGASPWSRSARASPSTRWGLAGGARSYAYGRRAELYEEDIFVPIDDHPAVAQQLAQPSTIYVHAPRPLQPAAPAQQEPAAPRDVQTSAGPLRGRVDVDEATLPLKEGVLGQSRAPALAAHTQEVAANRETQGPGASPSRFEDFGFPPAVVALLEGSGFEAPTPIQALSWPEALAGRDVVGVARTGGGKTLAYLLPGLLHAASRAAGEAGPLGLILAPTRELVLQVQTECFRFGEALGISEAAIYGGVARRAQAQAVRRGPQICIATPGRLLDFLESGVLSLHSVSYLVVDEADRMLDMGFGPQLRQVLAQLPSERQTLLWSATWPREIQHLAAEVCCQAPVSVSVDSDGDEGLSANPSIRQEVHVVTELDKRQRFLDWLRTVCPVGAPLPRILIFAGTKRGADALCRELRFAQFQVACLHSDKEQPERDRILHHFRTGRVGILVATDVAQRGLDIPGIAYVVNYDLPRTPQDYLHRIGRTGRAGAVGSAVTFFGLGRMTLERLRMARAIVAAMRAAGQEPPVELQALLEE